MCQSVVINCNPCTAVAKFKVDSVSKTGIVYVTNQSTGAFSYSWDWGDSSYSKIKSPIYHAYKYGGSRKICLTVWDSLSKCSTTYCLTVQVIKSRSSQQNGTMQSGKSGIQVYPNPADHSSIISWNGQYSNLSLYAASGKLVYCTSISGDKATLKTAELLPGIYTIQIQGTEGRRTSRLVVQRNP